MDFWGEIWGLLWAGGEGGGSVLKFTPKRGRNGDFSLQTGVLGAKLEENPYPNLAPKWAKMGFLSENGAFGAKLC